MKPSLKNRLTSSVMNIALATNEKWVKGGKTGAWKTKGTTKELT